MKLEVGKTYAAHSGLVSDRPQIPHADLIRAALDGKVVQYHDQRGWVDFFTPKEALVELVEGAHLPSELRLKPENVVRWSAIYKAMRSVQGLYVDRDNCIAEFPGLDLLLRVELDPDTLAVIDARTEAP